MSDFILKKIIDVEFSRISIIDVGAMSEGVPRYEIVEKNYDTILTGFEPNKDEYNELIKKSGTKRNYINAFLGNGKKAEFRLARYPGCSSLFEPDNKMIDLFTSIGASEGGNFQVIKRESVETSLLDDVYDLPDAHYIKIDVQGGELDVLKGGTKTILSTLVIESEVEFVPLYKGQPLFGDIQCFLREQGFLLHKLIDVSGRAFRPLQIPDNPYIPLSQMLWADAIFVRDFTNLSLISDEGLLVMAVVLNDIYRSYDLVHYILSEYDKRSGKGCSNKYLTACTSKDNKLDTLYLNTKMKP